MARRIKSMKNPSDPIENHTFDLLACSSVLVKGWRIMFTDTVKRMLYPVLAGW